MKARLAPAASADLDEILAYVDRQSPRGAIRLLDEFERRIDLLVTQPYSAPARDDLLPGLRCLVFGKYRCFYRILGKELVIARIIHGKRDLAEEAFET